MNLQPAKRPAPIVNDLNPFNHSLWLEAATRGDLPQLRLLLSTDLLHTTNFIGQTAAIVCAEFGHFECLRFLIEAGSRIDARTATGSTAAMRAAQSGNADCLRLLLDFGTDIDLFDFEGYTPLHYAAYAGSCLFNQRIHPDCVLLLIDAGADLNATTHKGLTALDIARERTPDLVPVIRATLDEHILLNLSLPTSSSCPSRTRL